MGVKIATWGNSLAIRIPKNIVDALRLRKGDELELRIGEDGALELAKDERRERAIQRIREMARPLPPDFKFDREEANAR